MTFLALEKINKSYGSRRVVRDLDLGLDRGGLLCVLGPSGCGKTTTLHMIGGFLAPDSGRILLDGEDITRLPPERRPVSTVFQSYGLFAHMNVAQNVAYGLKFRRMRRTAALGKAAEYLRLVGLDGYASARVGELSGGQQQRVALARALVVEPKICLLDEPLSNLDAALRIRMRTELKRLQRDLGITMLFVTHDQEEAAVLADRIAVMNDGAILQEGPPRELYAHPADGFVASFLRTDEMRWQDDGTLIRIVPRV